ncbi:hypothetical protein OIE67_19410 [Nonomuraea fuscirosea]|uniref:hypothetical protein n=1 Tax=Nonomuraea fuscirosea TaxID=1291556 RepID=UPI002DDB6DBF|nr:hypothetical protein [Nonomuraea fuscirosea]WSA56698.1 hypothetical protein OIE67_19410 [Nonomuraea fuscirosea]
MVGPQAELGAAEFRAAALKARGRGLLEAVRTLAWFHWSRFRALPSAEGESDLFDVLTDLTLEIAPEELRPVLHAAIPYARFSGPSPATRTAPGYARRSARWIGRRPATGSPRRYGGWSRPSSFPAIRNPWRGLGCGWTRR